MKRTSNKSKANKHHHQFDLKEDGSIIVNQSPGYYNNPHNTNNKMAAIVLPSRNTLNDYHIKYHSVSSGSGLRYTEPWLYGGSLSIRPSIRSTFLNFDHETTPLRHQGHLSQNNKGAQVPCYCSSNINMMRKKSSSSVCKRCGGTLRAAGKFPEMNNIDNGFIRKSILFDVDDENCVNYNDPYYNKPIKNPESPKMSKRRQLNTRKSILECDLNPYEMFKEEDCDNEKSKKIKVSLKDKLKTKIQDGKKNILENLKPTTKIEKPDLKTRGVTIAGQRIRIFNEQCSSVVDLDIDNSEWVDDPDLDTCVTSTPKRPPRRKCRRLEEEKAEISSSIVGRNVQQEVKSILKKPLDRINGELNNSAIYKTPVGNIGNFYLPTAFDNNKQLKVKKQVQFKGMHPKEKKEEQLLLIQQQVIEDESDPSDDGGVVIDNVSDSTLSCSSHYHDDKLHNQHFKPEPRTIVSQYNGVLQKNNINQSSDDKKNDEKCVVRLQRSFSTCSSPANTKKAQGDPFNDTMRLRLRQSISADKLFHNAPIRNNVCVRPNVPPPLPPVPPSTVITSPSFPQELTKSDNTDKMIFCSYSSPLIGSPKIVLSGASIPSLTKTFLENKANKRAIIKIEVPPIIEEKNNRTVVTILTNDNTDCKSEYGYRKGSSTCLMIGNDSSPDVNKLTITVGYENEYKSNIVIKDDETRATEEVKYLEPVLEADEVEAEEEDESKFESVHYMSSKINESLTDQDVGFDDSEPIYEEISEHPPPLPSEPPPSKVEDTGITIPPRSIFEGASKYDILRYLAGAKERCIIPEEPEFVIDEYLDNDSNNDLTTRNTSSLDLISSRNSNLSNVSDSSDELANLLSAINDSCSISSDKVCKTCADIERNDSGVGSESSKCSRSRWQHLASSLGQQDNPLPCEDCDQPVETELSDCGTVYAPLVCRKCSKIRIERREIITEIVETEEKYGRDLRIILEEFYRPMLVAGLLNPDQLSSIFLNSEELLENNTQLAEKLRDAYEIAMDQGDEDLLTVDIGRMFLDVTSMLHAFESYCTRQGNAALLLANLEKEKELLRIFLRVSQMENTVLRRMNLNSFLMVPVQRVTKYPLLLARLYKVTPEHQTSQRELLKDAQHNIELHLEHINSVTKDMGSMKLWRRISVGKRSGMDADDMVNIKLQKMAVEVLDWGHEDVRFAMEGRLLYAQTADYNYRRAGRTIKVMPVNALLVTLGKPFKTYNPKSKDLLTFPQKNGIRDASLLLMKEKAGRYSLLRDPMYLDRCIVCCDNDWSEYFELQEIPTKDTFIFKAEDGERTKEWYKQLQYHCQGLGCWRRRRNALANIMINGMQVRHS